MERIGTVMEQVEWSGTNRSIPFFTEFQISRLYGADRSKTDRSNAMPILAMHTYILKLKILKILT